MTTALATAILTRSPIQYLKLDETSGTTFADSSGNGRTGAALGGVTVGTSMGAYTAARLDGINGLVNLYSVSLANAFTPNEGSMVLIASLTSDAVDAFLFNLGASLTRSISSQAFADGLGAVLPGARRQVLSGNNVLALGEQTLALALPLLIGVSWSTADTIRLYVNGSQVAAGTALNAWGAFALAATRCVIGALNSVGGGAWTGSVAQWALFGSALSAADFAAIYAASGLATQTLTVPLLTNSSNLFVPSLRQSIVAPLLTSNVVLYTPTLQQYVYFAAIKQDVATLSIKHTDSGVL